MIYEIGMSIGFLLLLGISLWLAIRFYKKKKKIAEEQKNNIPKEILDLFNHAEEQMKGGLNENGNTTNPYKILWEARNPRTGGIESVKNSEPTISNGELYSESLGGQDFQIGTDTESKQDKPIVGETKRNSIRSIIRRRRRKTNN